MARSSVLRLVKGDIIIERVNGKNRMTPVRQLEFSACSSRGVHVNRNMCYDSSAVVEIVDGGGTLGDLEDELSEFEEDFDPGVQVNVGDVDLMEAWADKLIKA